MAYRVKKTWGVVRSERVRTIYVWANKKTWENPPEGEVKMAGDDMVVGIPDGGKGILKKTILSYKFAIENLEFDYVFRCCSGSYVVPELLVEFASKKPKEGVWCGVIPHKIPFPYVSGAGMLLSRDLVKLLADNMDEVMKAPFPGHVDDMAVGWFMKNRGIKPDPKCRRACGKIDIVPGCYHYHYRTHWKQMRVIHRKLVEQGFIPGSPIV